MTTRPLNVYVNQGRGQRDYADCQTALDRVPARLESLPFIGDADQVIQRARDADGLIVSSSPVTRRVMEALEGLKVIMRTGVGYDVIDPEVYAPGHRRRGP
jgi:phosphoglycerate dehydrogenase-like enzyme